MPLVLLIGVVTYQLKPTSSSLLPFVSFPKSFVSQAGTATIADNMGGKVIGINLKFGFILDACVDYKLDNKILVGVSF